MVIAGIAVISHNENKKDHNKLLLHKLFLVPSTGAATTILITIKTAPTATMLN
jgi:hypothetical protein